MGESVHLRVYWYAKETSGPSVLLLGLSVICLVVDMYLWTSQACSCLTSTQEVSHPHLGVMPQHVLISVWFLSHPNLLPHHVTH